jgi:hypothetical protein
MILSVCPGFFLGFFNACILRYYLSKPLTTLSCPLNAVFPGLKMRYTFAFDCFLTFKVRPRTGVQPQSLNRLLATAIFLSNYTVQLQCLQRAHGRRVTEKSHFSTLNIGLSGTWNRTQATCLAGSVSRRSAIHYASVCPFTKYTFPQLDCVFTPLSCRFILLRTIHQMLPTKPHTRNECTNLL